MIKSEKQNDVLLQTARAEKFGRIPPTSLISSGQDDFVERWMSAVPISVDSLSIAVGRPLTDWFKSHLCSIVLSRIKLEQFTSSIFPCGCEKEVTMDEISAFRRSFKEIWRSGNGWLEPIKAAIRNFTRFRREFGQLMMDVDPFVT